MALQDVGDWVLPLGPCGECCLRAVSMGCHRGLSLRLYNLLDWGLHSKELLGAMQENVSSVVLSLPLPLSLSFYRTYNIHAYRFTIVHEMHFGMLPVSKRLLLQKIIQTENQLEILSKPMN